MRSKKDMITHIYGLIVITRRWRPSYDHTLTFEVIDYLVNVDSLQ